MNKDLTKTVILLGGNLGQVTQTFAIALRELQKLGEVTGYSSLYRSRAWGMDEGTPDFYNRALQLKTAISPDDLLGALLDIEKKFGRKRKVSKEYRSRQLDLDIIFYGDKIIETQRLVVPHPRMQLRSFTLKPLLEIIPEFVHPVLQKRIQQLYYECPDRAKVIRC